MAKSAKVARPVDPVLTEFVTIKRLLVFALLKSGASQGQVAAALGVAQSQISRMFPDGIGDPSARRRSR
jgi:predicted XRE-type DNA-binding protein